MMRRHSLAIGSLLGYKEGTKGGAIPRGKGINFLVLTYRLYYKKS
jgi:hypothetical protein